MKNTILPFVLFTLLLSWNFSGAQIYVNHLSEGANTGTSWDDAFTNLQDALSAAETGDEIWVAAGTYKPADPGGTAASTFLLDKDLQLLGGFAGNEITADERDPEANPTILSGDLNGDDVDDDYTLNRGDNVMTVLTLQAVVTGETLIDGFTIRNGQADGGGGGPGRNGGAIYCAGSPVIRQCNFTQNFAFDDGGAVAVAGILAKGTLIEDCQFEKNRVDGYGGGLSISGPVSVFPGVATQIINSSFLSNHNTDSRGGGLAVVNANVQVTGSSFIDNANREQGGALWVFVTGGLNYEIEVNDCYFENNRASFGGGLYFLNLGHNTSLTFRNSQFSENSVFPMGNGWGQGGGGVCMYLDEDLTNANITFQNCSFDGNTSTGSGGGVSIFNNVNGGSFFFDNCIFEKNSCTYNGSALAALLNGSENEFMLKNSQFVQNSAELDAGAVDIYGMGGSSGTATVDSCLFHGNIATYNGGLNMNVWNGGSMDFFLTNSVFTNNEAEEGGAMGLWSSQNLADDISLYSDNCLFDGNIGTVRAGAIAFNPECDKFEVIINRATIINNESPRMGAIGSYYFTPGAFSGMTNIQIENSLIVNNISDDAAISVDSTGNFSLLNSTVANNQSKGIEIGDESGLTLQNTILANPGYLEYDATSGDVTITSNGGNLILDNSLNGFLVDKDKPETEPDFLPDTYQPSSNSPLVNGGNNNGVTAEFDLAANPRIQHDIVDIGAYESPFDLVSAREVIVGELKLSPNPAVDYLTIQFPETVTLSTLDLSLFDARGRQVEARAFAEGQPLAVKHLPNGIYTLKLTDGQQIFTGKFVKQ